MNDSEKKSGRVEYIAVNLPKVLLDKLDQLVERVNDSGLMYISSRAECVKRAIEAYIQHLNDILNKKTTTE